MKAWKEPRLSLKKLYHPGGLTGNTRGVAGYLDCPCGCKPDRIFKGFEQSAEQLGIRDTPAMREIARLKKVAAVLEKANRPPKVMSPWKGARPVLGMSQIDLPILEDFDHDGDPVPCRLGSDCSKKHKRWGFGRSAGLYHVKVRDVRTYQHPSGAVARIRTNRRIKGFKT